MIHDVLLNNKTKHFKHPIKKFVIYEFIFSGALKMDVTLYLNHALCTGLNDVNVWSIVYCDKYYL